MLSEALSRLKTYFDQPHQKDELLLNQQMMEKMALQTCF